MVYSLLYKWQKQYVIPKVTTLAVVKTTTFSSIHAHTPKWMLNYIFFSLFPSKHRIVTHFSHIFSILTV